MKKIYYIDTRKLPSIEVSILLMKMNMFPVGLPKFKIEKYNDKI